MASFIPLWRPSSALELPLLNACRRAPRDVVTGMVVVIPLTVAVTGPVIGPEDLLECRAGVAGAVGGVLDRQPVGVTGQATPCRTDSPSASVPLLTAPVVVRVNTVACAGPAAPIVAITPASRTVLHVTVTFLLFLSAMRPLPAVTYIAVYNGGLFTTAGEAKHRSR